jgi:lysophospholipase L1-like esterase
MLPMCSTRHATTNNADAAVFADASAIHDASLDALATLTTLATPNREQPDASPDAALADVMEALRGKIVLHAGDSTVGGEGGLTLALRARFTELGVKKFHSDTWVSTSLISFAGEPRFARVLARTTPDVVILTLGTNDVHVPAPESLAPKVRAIVKRIGARECYWMGPLFIKKKDTGIVAMLRENVKPCVFFDSSELDIPRTTDRIHPTKAGGEAWASAFWNAMEQARRAPDSTQPSLER